MRLLPGVVGGRRSRRLAAVCVPAAAVIALAGCSQFDAALGQREALITFRSGTTVAQRLAVRSACAKIPHVTAPPLPADLSSRYALQQLTYRLDKATDTDVARLETCLAKYPAVAGVTLQDSSDEGN